MDHEHAKSTDLTQFKRGVGIERERAHRQAAKKEAERSAANSSHSQRGCQRHESCEDPGTRGPGQKRQNLDPGGILDDEPRRDPD